MHINIKAMLAMIKDEPEDKYIPVLKPILEALLNENKMLRRKNSQPTSLELNRLDAYDRGISDEWVELSVYEDIFESKDYYVVR